MEKGDFMQGAKFLLKCLASLTLLSCQGPSKVDVETLIVGVGSEPQSLDPRFATDAIGTRLLGLLFNAIVKVGPDLKPKGDLAQSWSYQKGVWEFHLKPHLSFSNSRRVAREDILFSFEQYLGPKSPFRSAFKDVERVDVEESGKGHFVLKLKVRRYSAKFLLADLPVIRVLPKKEVLQHGQDFQKALVGTGSFILEKRDSQNIVLLAREDHPYQVPKIKKVVFKVIRDDFTRYQKLLKGELDIVQEDLPFSKIKQFQKLSSQFEVFKNPSQTTTYLLFNLKNPILKKKNLRKSIAHSLKVDEIIKYNLEGFAIKASSLLPPNNPFFEKSITKFPHSLRKATELLKDMKFSKPLVLKTSNSPATVKNAKVIITHMKKAGIPVELQTFEWGTYYTFLKKGQFDLTLSAYVGILDPDIYRLAFHSHEVPPKGRNRGFYLNNQVDRWIEQGNVKVSQKERFEVYSQIQRKVHGEDIAMLPLWHKSFVAVVNRRVKGYSPALNGSFQPFLKVYKAKEK